MDKLKILKSVFVFGGLEESLLVKISAHLKEVKFAAGAEIFLQGRKADSFYIVGSGEVVILKKPGEAREKILAVLAPGSVFGEMAFFSDSPRTANAISKTDTRLWKIEHADFMNFIAEEPKAGLRILSGLLQVSMDRLDHTSNELATIYHTGKIITGGMKLDVILAGVLEEILLAVPEAEDGAIYVYNEFNGEFDPAVAPQGAKEIGMNNLLVNSMNKDPGSSFSADAETIMSLKEIVAGNAKSVLVSPIIKDAKLLGFILLWNARSPEAFNSNHLLLAATVASQLAEAVENIRHRQEEQDRQRLNNAKQSY
jgi:CRP-like cAMP-binding protein